jgi:arylsulfatase A-like enzyme
MRFPIPALLVFLAVLSPAAEPSVPATGTKPNIVVLYADDLGYGDVQCYNPERGKLPTPHIDRLASQGMRFTDGHSSSGVCSPSRYALLTGRYHWRSRLQSGIVGLWEKPLIAPDRLTIANLLKDHGYTTAMVGKWHLGWDWPIPTGKGKLLKGSKKQDLPATAEQKAAWKDIFSQPIPGGPTSIGFDSYFGTDVPNWPPYCFIENDRTVGIPTEFLPVRLFKSNMASLQGPALADWKLEPILPALGDRAGKFIRTAAKKDTPFFLYMPLTAPHTPLAVNPQWKGKSGLGTYGDFVMETDAVVGQVLAAIEKSGEADNTLVVFTSDNGCAPYIGVPEMEKQGHFPSGPLRGYKSDAWEGGHRVPFIVRWPGKVGAGTRCDQLVHQTDLMATFAGILDAQLPVAAGEDSVSLLPLLKGGNKPVRNHAVSHSVRGLPALRRGPWKLIFGPGSGGWSKGKSPHPAQLYKLDDDLGETKNLYAENPDIVAELTALMDEIVRNGRSTPGATQKNDVPVKWRRFLQARPTARKGKP